MGSDFTIPKDGYLQFDATSFKQAIIDRLNEGGVFTDQKWPGSYLTTVVEILAYYNHVLLFYLNKTSTESMFSESQLYENMNRIVKLLDYKPVGKQTATLSFELSAGSQLNSALYTIPRYSYVENAIGTYSFNEDINFAKTAPYGTMESLDDTASQKLLYQGRYTEYPLYNAVGNDNEIVFFDPGENVLVDHFNIDVYVKNNGTWTQWKRTQSLYLEDAFAKKFEIRLNENKKYELKFGNSINGTKLNNGDVVAIYYLESNGSDGEVSGHIIRGKLAHLFVTETFEQILADLNTENQYNYIDSIQIKYLSFDNTTASTIYQAEETVDNIRQNAPANFRSQYRVVTVNDYETYIKTNFANLLYDVKAANNWTYLSEQLKYYYDLGITNPNNVSNILYNQVNFADACNFNNIYLTVVPKTITDTLNPMANMTPSQKELIITTLQDIKVDTSEVIILDPVYIAFDIGLPKSGTVGSIDDINYTEMVVIKQANSRRDPTSIQSEINNIFINYFMRSNQKLGQVVDINYLTSAILNVGGVDTFYCRRTDDTNVTYNGLSMICWNPIYPTDQQLILKNLSLSYFKYAFLNDIEHFSEKIVISSTAKIFENIEY